jgi:hypothetical protein
VSIERKRTLKSVSSHLLWCLDSDSKNFDSHILSPYLLQFHLLLLQLALIVTGSLDSEVCVILIVRRPNA